MKDVAHVVEVVERIGCTVIDAEWEHWRSEFVDDNTFIPLLRRIVEATERAAASLGIPTEAVDELRSRLQQHAENRYLETWMSHLAPDEDPEEMRDDGLRVFRHVWNGGRR